MTSFDKLNIAVKQSIHLWMEENINDCLGNHGEVVDLTKHELLCMIQDCDHYINMAKIKVDVDLDGDNVFTGRYMLWNKPAYALLKPFKKELLEWASQHLEVDKTSYIDVSEFLAVCWLAYLKTNMQKVNEYYNNECESIYKLYF